MTSRSGAEQRRLARDQMPPLRYVMPFTALVSMGLTWPIVTSHNLSYHVLHQLFLLAIVLSGILLARRRWVWVIASLLAAGCLYVGVRLGGLIGITNVVIGIGLGSMALIVTLEEAQRIIAGSRHINSLRSFVDVERGNDREVV